MSYCLVFSTGLVHALLEKWSAMAFGDRGQGGDDVNRDGGNRREIQKPLGEEQEYLVERMERRKLRCHGRWPMADE